MKKYYIGYDNKPWKPMTDFVIMAETTCKGVAMMIRDSYNKAYEEVGMSSRLVIANENDIKGFRYAED